MRSRNERLERELNFTTAERDGLKATLERILAISELAFRGSRPKGTTEVGSPKRPQECND